LFAFWPSPSHKMAQFNRNITLKMAHEGKASVAIFLAYTEIPYGSRSRLWNLSSPFVGLASTIGACIASQRACRNERGNRKRRTSVPHLGHLAEWTLRPILPLARVPRIRKATQPTTTKNGSMKSAITMLTEKPVRKTPFILAEPLQPGQERRVPRPADIPLTSV
jgi:hypothetical protein